MRIVRLASAFGACAALALLPCSVQAQSVAGLLPSSVPLYHPAQAIAQARSVSLARPVRLASINQQAPNPCWVGQELLVGFGKTLFGLSRVEKAGYPVFDPSSDALYASANGALVRLAPDGALQVVADGVQGVDVDVRAAKGMAVSREPDDKIVLHRFGGSKTVLLQGPQYFAPRFSPDGNRVLVSESRAGGGHFWVVTLDGKATDVTQGYGPSWHPDGRHVVFSRIENDKYRITAADLWLVNVDTRSEWRVQQTPAAEIEPAISADGSMIAFVDALTGALYAAPFQLPATR